MFKQFTLKFFFWFSVVNRIDYNSLHTSQFLQFLIFFIKSLHRLYVLFTFVTSVFVSLELFWACWAVFGLAVIFYFWSRYDYWQLDIPSWFKHFHHKINLLLLLIDYIILFLEIILKYFYLLGLDLILNTEGRYAFVAALIPSLNNQCAIQAININSWTLKLMLLHMHPLNLAIAFFTSHMLEHANW